MSLLEIQAMLSDFSNDRPTLKDNNTPLRVLSLLASEVEEARVAVVEENGSADIAQEISDVLIFALTLANQYGLNMDDEVREKIAFNMTRYTADKFQSGSYEEARQQAKREEKAFAKRDFYAIV